MSTSGGCRLSKGCGSEHRDQLRRLRQPADDVAGPTRRRPEPETHAESSTGARHRSTAPGSHSTRLRALRVERLVRLVPVPAQDKASRRGRLLDARRDPTMAVPRHPADVAGLRPDRRRPGRTHWDSSSRSVRARHTRSGLRRQVERPLDGRDARRRVGGQGQSWSVLSQVASESIDALVPGLGVWPQPLVDRFERVRHQGHGAALDPHAGPGRGRRSRSASKCSVTACRVIGRSRDRSAIE